MSVSWDSESKKSFKYTVANPSAAGESATRTISGVNYRNDGQSVGGPSSTSVFQALANTLRSFSSGTVGNFAQIVEYKMDIT